MSRELKFRVYIPDFGKMVYFDLGCFNYSDRYLYQDKYPVQQYTGLKDSKGNEIFEGDLIKGKFDFGPAGYIEQTLPVKWDNVKGYQWNYWDLATIEVIGNNYELSKNIEVNYDYGKEIIAKEKKVCEKCCKSPASTPHTCPYKEDINGDYTTLCNCCDECEHECCMDI